MIVAVSYMSFVFHWFITLWRVGTATTESQGFFMPKIL